MGQLKGLVMSVALALLVAYYTSTIVPEGFSQPYRLRILLTFSRFVTHLTSLSTIFGCEEVHTLRNILGVFENFVPQLNDSHVHSQDTNLDGIRVRIFTPLSGHGQKYSKKLRPGIIFLHGGGWSIGNVVTSHHQTYEISRQTGAVVVSVEYRLAPEYPFPIGFEDCVRATKFFMTNSKDFGVDVKRVAVKGDSAGGNLAAAVVLRLRNDKFTPKPKLQVLVYPSLQATDFNTPSMMYNKHGPFLTQRNTVHYKSLYLFGHPYHEEMQRVNNHTSPNYKQNIGKGLLNHSYLPQNDEVMRAYKPLGDNFGNVTFWNENKETYLNPYFSPLHADDLSKLPNAYISTCQFDVLRDDGFFYAGRLKKAGVEVTHINLHVCFHGWMSFTDKIETAEESFKNMIEFIKENL